jgi:hypothetical protein
VVGVQFAVPLPESGMRPAVARFSLMADRSIMVAV